MTGTLLDQHTITLRKDQHIGVKSPAPYFHYTLALT
jgi:hypothetical protein